jgi:hypothetical protein
VAASAFLGLTLVAGGLFGWTGYLGGQIRHTEVRAASAATQDATAVTRRAHEGRRRAHGDD